MLDGFVRARIDQTLHRIGGLLAGAGFSANSITITGCILGLGAGFSISQHFFIVGAILIGLSRLCDGLDGSVAKINGKTDLGGYLDIVLDFAFYGMIPVGFAFADPQNNAIAAVALLFSFYLNGASFLAYAIMAEKRGLQTEVRGSKSLFFTTGLAEATETIAVFLLACLMPDWFSTLAWGFAVICIYTAIVRIFQAAREFG